MQKQKNTIRKRAAYLATLCLVAIVTASTSVKGALIEWNILSGGSATLIIILIIVVATVFVYLKFFKGSIDFSKLGSKIKSKISKK